MGRKQRLYITGQADIIFSEDCLAMFSYACKSSANECRQPDGSGYMVVPRAPHNFYGLCDPSVEDTKMKCSYAQSSELWGLKRAADWLAKAASATKAITTDANYEEGVSCDEQAIEDTRDNCGPIVSASRNIAPTTFLGSIFIALMLYR